jgi:hypothetical protein
MSRSRRARAFGVPVIWMVVALATPRVLSAQSFGLSFEAGAAFVENHDAPARSFGLSLLVPLGNTLVGSISYAQWSGGDTNDTGAGAGRFFGDRGLNVTFYAPAYRGDRFAWLLGAGVGQYERIVRDPGGTDREFQGALTASTMLAFGLGDRWSFFLKGLISAPTAEATPRWGITHAGLAVRL